MPSHHQFQLSLPLLEALLFYLVTSVSIFLACFNHIPFFNHHLKQLCFSMTKWHIIPLPGTPYCIFRSSVCIFIPEPHVGIDLHVQHLLFQQFSIVTTETGSENAAPKFLHTPQREILSLGQNSDLTITSVPPQMQQAERPAQSLILRNQKISAACILSGHETILLQQLPVIAFTSV